MSPFDLVPLLSPSVSPGLNDYQELPMTDLPRIQVAAGDTGVKVFITWPDGPAATVLRGPGYGSDHLGYTPHVPEQAVEFLPAPAQRRAAP